jgi:hypothetical protein
VTVTDEPNKARAPDPELDLGWDLDDAAEENARPTVAPPFDLETYAKASMAPASSAVEVPAPPPPLSEPAPPEPQTRRSSDVPQAAQAPPIVPNRVISLPPPPPLRPRPVVVPRASVAAPPLSQPQLAPQPEHAPVMVEAPVTKPPPRDDLAAFSAIITPVPPSSSPPSQKITPREMQRIDAALALSKQEQSSRSVADERASQPPRADSVLAMANQRAPLLTPPRVPAVAAPTAAPPNVREAPPAAIADPVVEMQERFALGDYSGALVMAESMLDENPTHVEAREYAESCRSVLQQMYTARIGPLDRVPVVEVARDQLRWLSIDHRTGFILSLVDGISSLEMILDVSGMPPLDALRMLFELVQQRIISVRDG